MIISDSKMFIIREKRQKKLRKKKRDYSRIFHKISQNMDKKNRESVKIWIGQSLEISAHIRLSLLAAIFAFRKYIFFCDIIKHISEIS